MNNNKKTINIRNIIKRHCQTYFEQRGDVINIKLLGDFTIMLGRLCKPLGFDFTVKDLVKIFVMEYCLYFNKYQSEAKQILRDIGFPELSERDEFNKFNYLPKLISNDNIIMPKEINR